MTRIQLNTVTNSLSWALFRFSFKSNSVILFEKQIRHRAHIKNSPGQLLVGLVVTLFREQMNF